MTITQVHVRKAVLTEAMLANSAGSPAGRGRGYGWWLRVSLSRPTTSPMPWWGTGSNIGISFPQRQTRQTAWALCRCGVTRG